MIITPHEIKFLNSVEEARLATCHDDIPHVKPVSFIFNQNLIFVATDYETRSFQNIKKNSKVAIVIDIYKPNEHKAICIQGVAEILESGPEFDSIYKIFLNKFQWVRNDPWKPGEAPILKIVPKSKVSWGLNK